MHLGTGKDILRVEWLELCWVECWVVHLVAQMGDKTAGGLVPMWDGQAAVSSDHWKVEKMAALLVAKMVAEMALLMAGLKVVVLDGSMAATKVQMMVVT